MVPFSPRRAQPLLLLAIAALIGIPAWAAEETYPNAKLLIEPGELAKPKRAQQFLILDARTAQDFQQERILQARWVDAAAWAKAFGEGKDADAWSRRIGELGIATKSKVVVYDDVSAKDAARIWWILRYWGVNDVRLLNGGWKGWKSARLPVATDKPEPPAPMQFTAAPRSQRLVTKQQVLDSLPGQRLQIVDARSEKEHCGLDPLTNKRAGAIPGAKLLEWSDLLDPQTQRFRAAAEIRRLFQQAGIELEKPTAAHCQSGGRASVMAFALELMGAKQVGNYYPGWSEWGNADDTPIVAGKPKQKSQ
jgi:thiosulfate/3-mercaptopyruvate sulfurtransferase